jgi:ketosteroid isomerase-like protein
MPDRRFLSFLLCVLAGLPALAGEAGEIRDARASLLRAESQFARTLQYAGPVDGFVKWASADIAFLAPDQEILTGRLAAQAWLRAAYADFRPDVRMGLHRLAGDVSADGRLGYTLGWFDELKSRRDSNSVDLGYGRYLAVWRRTDRDWQIEAFLRLASTGPLPPPPAEALILDGETGERLRDHPLAHALGASVADARFADLSAAQGYSVAFSRYAADAALLVTAGNFYWNRAGVEAAFGGWVPDQSLRWHPLRAEGTGSGDLAWSVGHGTFHFGVGTGNETRTYSKYLTVWLRTPQGWRFLIDGGNARPADPAQ